jgi:hypothetical protein
VEATSKNSITAMKYEPKRLPFPSEISSDFYSISAAEISLITALKKWKRSLS